MDADDFVTLSARGEAALRPGMSLEESLRGSLIAFAAALREGGCTMIGHVKGMVEDGVSQPLFFSLTSLDGEPRFKGGPIRSQSGLRLSMNVIAAGIDGESASLVLDGALSEHFRYAPQA